MSTQRPSARCSGAVLVAACVTVAACGGRAALPPPAPPPTEYRLGVDDDVEVLVWKEPQLSTTVPVRPDGRISVPLVGELPAAGRTAGELERDIVAALSRTISSPSVTVLVKEIRSARVYVLGEVAQPGAFPVRGPISALQAIALAGGLTEFADRDGIVLLRRGPDGAQQRYGFDYDAAVDGGNPGALIPGDTLVVP